MKKIICEAIKGKKILTFYYDGGKRRTEPYCYGRGKKGNDFLRAYQISGYSRSGSSQGWKLFDMSKLSSIIITDETFNKIRPKYKPKDPQMSKIYCKIEKTSYKFHKKN